MKVTLEINIQRLILLEWLIFTWNLVFMNIRRLLIFQWVIVADLFLYSHEADCVQHLHKGKFKKQNNIIYSHSSLYIDDVL